MAKKFLSVSLVILLLGSIVSLKPAYAGANPEKQARLTQEVKAAIQKLGVGSEARVSVRLRDKTKLAGYLREAAEDSFVVIEGSSGRAVSVAYADVAQVKGHNLSRGYKIAIGVALIAAIFILAFVFAPET